MFPAEALKMETVRVPVIVPDSRPENLEQIAAYFDILCLISSRLRAAFRRPTEVRHTAC